MFGSILTYRGIDLVTSAVSGSADAENTSTNTGAGPTSFAWTGQSWTSPSSPSALTGIRLQLSKSGVAPVGLVRVAVYAESSDLPIGASLVASPFYATDGLTTVTDYYFPLSGWTPAASTKYVFLLELYDVFSGGGSSLSWRSNTTSTYAGGVQVLPLNGIPPNEDRYASQISAAEGSAGTISEMQFTVYSVNGNAASVVDCTSATGTLLQSLDETGSVSVYSDVTYDKVGQTFASAGMREISGFCFALSKVGAPTGTINLSVKAHTGTFGSTGEPTGAALASSLSYDVSTLTSTSSPTDRFFFPLITPITGPLGTYYTVEFDLTGVTGDGTNYVNVWADSGLAGSSSGNLFHDTGAGYTAVSNRDLLMRVYGSAENYTAKIRPAVGTGVQFDFYETAGTGIGTQFTIQ